MEHFDSQLLAPVSNVLDGKEANKAQKSSSSRCCDAPIFLSEFDLENTPQELDSLSEEGKERNINTDFEETRVQSESSSTDPLLTSFFASNLPNAQQTKGKDSSDLNHTLRVSTCTYELQEIPMPPVVYPEDYILFLNDEDRAFVKKHSQPDVPIPQLTAMMCKGIIQTRKRAAVNESNDHMNETSDWPSQSGTPLNKGLEYEGHIWKYNPKKVYRMNYFNKEEDHFIDPRNSWEKTPFGHE